MQQRTVRLKSCRKTYTRDQDKALSPEETVTRLLDRLQKLDLRILEEVQRIDSGRLGIPVYFSVCGQDAREVIGTKKQMGKGSTPEQSMASACMELAERFSFFSFIKNPDNFLVGDYAAMRDGGYPLPSLELLLQSVHDENLPVGDLDRLLAGLPMRWTWATRLSDNQDLLLPFSWFFAINEFNGPSAGNTYEEAALQGISEVVERHVCALVTKERLETPAIALKSVQDPVAVQLINAFINNGIELYLNDFTLNTGIPTVAALAWDPVTFPQQSEIVYTAGTTPDPNKALIRALTEVAQLAGDFNSGSNYVASGLPKPASLEEVRHILDTGVFCDMDSLVSISAPDMYEEIHSCQRALAAIGMEIYCMDVTHGQLQVPALYTSIPGAHFRERASGGRAALFAAKLAAELLRGRELEAKLDQMQSILPGAYYLAFYRGQMLYAQEQTEAALSHFAQALASSPDPEDLPYIHSYHGACLRDLQRFDQAVVTLQQGLAVDEERPDLHNTLGVCYFKLGDHRQAARHFQRAIELNPVSAIDYANLGLNLELLGEAQEAMTQYRVALELDPGIAFAASHLAELEGQYH
ncbi:MAG: hypothetical protein CSA34_02320 [Desulfobulbus propionicus]|nr:MAG: hypothetical protein CSA34_02320 [Desulfobulbus propionicus]